jgi:hypothetical protein
MMERESEMRLAAAAVAMHALLSARGGNLAGHDAKAIAKAAFDVADAMVEEALARGGRRD